MRTIKDALVALATAALLLAGCGHAGKEETKTASRPTRTTMAQDAAPIVPSDADAPEPTVVKAEPDPVLTCETVSKTRSPGLCGVLEKAPRASLELASTQRAIEVWRKMEAPFAALSGRETALTVLSADARIGEGDDAKPLPPAAFICPGAPPTVYVPSTLLSLIADRGVAKNKYPEDFLAFVLGHELAHRMNDLTPDGCQLAAFQRPGKGQREEELADSRSAFFMTNVGYSASKIATGDLVSKFLEAEFELGRKDSKGRRNSLLAALASFDGYEALYRAALMVAMTGEMEAADRLLSWADELLSQRGVPLPEIRVLRAVARINRAATMAPLAARLALPVAIDQLRCTPLHPGHSGLWEKPAKRVRGPDIELGRRLLKEALQMLSEAEALGATRFTVEAARTCAAFYLGDASTAKAAQSSAEKLQPKRVAAPVAKALANNRKLVDFLAYIEAKPTPEDEASKAFQDWAAAISQTLTDRNTPAELKAVLHALQDPSRVVTALAPDAPSCRESIAPAPLAPMPTSNDQPWQCPAGFRLAHQIPSETATENTGTTNRVIQCIAEHGEAQLVQVNLVGTTYPPLEALARTMLVTKPPAQLRDLATWSCYCTSLSLEGVSDEGELVYRARCPKLGVPRGALLTKSAKIHSIVQHSH